MTEINNQIQQLKEKYANVKGTKTEIYKRIVGYNRSVDNWNAGKKEENRDRKEFIYRG